MASSLCEPGYVMMSNFTDVASSQTITVCEDFRSLNGSMVFLSGKENTVVANLTKRVYTQKFPPDSLWFGLNGSLVHESPEDLLGLFVLNHTRATGQDPDYDSILAAVPPILSGWGASTSTHYEGQHTFTGSRNSLLDVVFDHKGCAGEWAGSPLPMYVIKENTTKGDVHEGLLGGSLPIVLFVFPVASNASAPHENCFWEFATAPVADTGGNMEQQTSFRYIRFCTGSGQVTPGSARYFDTYAYTPDYTPAAALHYQTILAQQRYWMVTWQTEHMMQLLLPSNGLKGSEAAEGSGAGGVGSAGSAGSAGGAGHPVLDGRMLVDQAVHSIIKVCRGSSSTPQYRTITSSA
jgi:hypothetical protein